MIIDLSIKINNIHFRNPFLLASAPPTRNGEMIIRGLCEGWAGAVTKTITLKGTISPQPRLAAPHSASIGSILENIELLSDYPVEQWCKWIEEIHKYADGVIIASIMASADKPDEWAELAVMMQDSGADAVELNVSCPHGMPERAAGAFIGQDASLTAEITQAVKEKLRIPVWVKLTPNVTDIAVIGKAAVSAGADCLAAINTLSGIAGVDLDTMNPIPNVGGYSAFGGISGPAVKPTALRCVAQLAQLGIPVSGMGGIRDWRDAAEFILLGASTVQVCTAVMFDGYGIIHNLTAGLKEYLQRQGLTSVEQLRGKALEKIIDYNSLNFRRKARYIVGPECYQCGMCVVSCRDGGYQAIQIESAKAVIDQKKCDGCGLCLIVCPVNAIKRTNTDV
ncbi:MAG: NAD-dependent dihydropyrimidine dehydrogenase subunit PreA [FCB group bacterium]|nr:NAD-dependent dihydropyrimidine dehydrogenase subunit PreA [FCB group bacterium]